MAIHMVDCTDDFYIYMHDILGRLYYILILFMMGSYICSRSDLKIHKEQSDLHDLEWQCFPGRCAFGCPRLQVSRCTARWGFGRWNLGPCTLEVIRTLKPF